MGEVETEMGLPVAETQDLPCAEEFDGSRASDRSERVSTEVGMVRHSISMGLESVVESYLCVALFRMGGWFKMSEEKKENIGDDANLADRFVKSQNEVEDIDERIRESRQERDAARRDVHKAIVAGRGLNERVEMLERAMLNPMKKGWRHPIAGNAFSNYHRCAACGGEFEDEVVMVVHRTRSGDHYYVFCSKQCLANYNDW